MVGGASSECHRSWNGDLMKTYIVDIKGVVIDADDWDNTTIHIDRNGEWCEIPFNKDDIVETKEDKEWVLRN